MTTYLIKNVQAVGAERGDIVIQDERVLMLCGDGRGGQRSQDAELRVSVVIAK